MYQSLLPNIDESLVSVVESNFLHDIKVGLQLVLSSLTTLHSSITSLHNWESNLFFK